MPIHERRAALALAAASVLFLCPAGCAPIESARCVGARGADLDPPADPCPPPFLDWEIRDREEAIAQARRYFGSSPHKPSQGDGAVCAAMHVESDFSGVDLVRLTEDPSPYIGMEGRRAWIVRTGPLRLTLPSGQTDRIERQFDVTLDAVEGSLLKIASRWPAGERAIAPEPDARSAARQLWAAGQETWRGLPAEPPPITFVEALDTVQRRGGDPFASAQIVAHCVDWSLMRGDAVPAWSIHLRGIPTIPAAYPGVPDDNLNHLRHIVHAESGNWLIATSSPQPDQLRPSAGGNGAVDPPPEPPPPPPLPSRAEPPQQDRRRVPNQAMTLHAIATAGFASNLAMDPPAEVPQVALSVSSPVAGQTIQPGSVVDWTITGQVFGSPNYGLAAIVVDLAQSPANPRLFDIPPAPTIPSAMAGFSRPAGICNPGPDGVGSGYAGTPVGPAGAKNLRQIGGAQNPFGIAGTVIGQDITVDAGIGLQVGGQVIAAGSFNAPWVAGTYSFSLESPLVNVLITVAAPPQISQVSPAVIASATGMSFTVWCVADYDGNGTIEPADVSLFVGNWFNDLNSGTTHTDVDGNGLIQPADISRFITLWFAALSTGC